jgi:hypothetical protein
MGQGENTDGVVTFSTAGDQYSLEWGWTSPEECVNPSKGECSGSKVGGELIGTCMTQIDRVGSIREGEGLSTGVTAHTEGDREFPGDGRTTMPGECESAKR